MAATLQIATSSRTDPSFAYPYESVTRELDARGLAYSVALVEGYAEPRLIVSDDEYGLISEFIGTHDILLNLDNVEEYVKKRSATSSTTFQIVSAMYGPNGAWQTADVIRGDGFTTEEEAITALFESLAEHVTHGVRKAEYRSEHYDGFTRYFVRPSNWWATLQTLTPATDDVMRAPDTY
jgi:hypothetical protein